MVVAALLRMLIQGECCFCSARFKFVTLNPFYVPADKAQRKDLRRRELGVWRGSIADDVDLIADWWYFSVVFDERGGFDDTLTLVLGIFTFLGTLTWLLEVFHLTCIRPNAAWPWLQILILLVEDIPQVVITYIIRDPFDNITPLGLFNITTSLYSLFIRLTGELFVNYCYCFERIRAPDPSMDIYVDEEEPRVAKYKGGRNGSRK